MARDLDTPGEKKSPLAPLQERGEAASPPLVKRDLGAMLFT